MERITKESIRAKLEKRILKHNKRIDADRKAFLDELDRQKIVGHVPENSEFIRLSKVGKALILALCIGLSGCGATRAEMIPGWKVACVEYGFQPGTDSFAGCVQKEFAIWQTNKARIGAAIAGGAMAKPSPTYRPAPMWEWKR